MGRIVAILILRSVASLLKTRLRHLHFINHHHQIYKGFQYQHLWFMHLKWGALSSNGRLQILNEGVLLLTKKIFYKPCCHFEPYGKSWKMRKWCFS